MKKIILSALLISFAFLVNAQSIQDAKKLTDNEQYENATALYQSLISKNPADASLYYFLGDNLLLSDNPDSARIIFDKGKTIDASNPFIKIGEAKILLDKISVREAKFSRDKDGGNREMQNRYDESVSNVSQAEKLIDEATTNSRDINILIEGAEALIHFKNKNTDKAKLLLDKASGMDQKNIEVLILYGDLYAELNNGTLSADYYNRALDQEKTSARAIVSKGKLYMRSTNYDGAAREFENAILLEPGYAPAHRELGEAYYKLGKLSQAKDSYKKYLEISKNNCSARLRYATFLYASKTYNEAIIELDTYKQRCDSNYVRMWRLYAYCYFEMKDSVNTAKGLNAINRLFNIVPHESRIPRDYEYFGKLLISDGQDSLGLEQLQKAFALDPARTDLLYEMALAWIKLKQYGNAAPLLQQKIATGKDVKVSDHYQLARALYFNKQFAEADSAAAKVTELVPNYASGWILRAQANSQIDSTSERGLAKPYYEKYIEIAIADSTALAKYQNGLIEAYSYLAYFYSLKDNYDEQKILFYLEEKLKLPLEPEDRNRTKKGIDQIKNPPPRQQKK